jgi:undecaprenyl diphosphate synthase
VIERVAALPLGAGLSVPDSSAASARHVAIIMDGNRRWAVDRGLASFEGHRAGVASLREIVRAAPSLGVEILTVYAFSEENWRRDFREVAALMELIAEFAERERESLVRDDVRVRVIGRADGLPASVRGALDTLTRATASCSGLRLNVALNYGARGELCDAVRALARDVASGRVAPASIDDDTLGTYLYTAGMPDPDLLIRTGGELRVSNFLLYQIAYTELWSTPVPWPAFDVEHLSHALKAFAHRQRRFGS